MCRTWHGASSRRSTKQKYSMICASLLVTDWRSFRAIEKSSGASASTTDGARVSAGRTAMHMMYALRIITERGKHDYSTRRTQENRLLRYLEWQAARSGASRRHIAQGLH